MKAQGSIRGIILTFLVIFLVGCGQGKPREQGYIEARFTYISAQVSGQLMQLAVHRGQTVKAGQLLFQLDLSPQAAELKEAIADLNESKANLANLQKGEREPVVERDMADVASAQATLTNAAKNLQRQQLLYHADFTEQSSLDSAQKNYLVAKANLQKANQQIVIDKLEARNDEIKAAESTVHSDMAVVRQKQWAVDQKTQRAVQAAFVYDTFYYPGEVVPANSPVMALVTPNNNYAVFFVKSPLLNQLKLGERVTLSCDHCQTSNAKITYISNKAEYAPPVIYGEESQNRLVYKVEAVPQKSKQAWHPGQPVVVTLP